MADILLAGLGPRGPEAAVDLAQQYLGQFTAVDRRHLSEIDRRHLMLAVLVTASELVGHPL
ncbi:hypothetical protein ACIO14_27855 [Nocardia fluminea]|uniref:hypothetical protein n=1 Tax=Nocardia fluminea TaxID=134984 RepID=UPI0038180353